MILFRTIDERRAVLKKSEDRLRGKMDRAADKFEPARRVVTEVRIN